jgi:hypothetical protein
MGMEAGLILRTKEIKTMKTTNETKNYLKVGKFKKKNVYDADVDMSPDMEQMFESLGKENITREQYINIGFNYALIKGLGEIKNKKK